MRQATNAKKRPLVAFGPGLVLAILASVAVWGLLPGLRREPPRVIPSSAGAPAPPSAPEPHWLASQARPLGLTPLQAAALARRIARWDRDTAVLRRDLDASSSALRQRMGAGDGGGKASLPQMQREAVPYAALSRQMADARAAWWQDARRGLTAHQQEQAEAMWARRFQPGNGDRR